MMNDATVLQKFEQARQLRSAKEKVWTRVERLFSAGDQMNSIGVWVVNVAVSALFTYLTPPGAYWFMAVPEDPRDAEDPNVRRWLFAQRNAVHAYLTRPGSGLFQTLPGLYRQLVTAGLGVHCTEWAPEGLKIFGRSYTEFYPLYDAYGELMMCFREYTLRQDQAEEVFGELPAQARQDPTKMQELQFKQAIFPGERIESRHYFNDTLVRTGFYYEWPWLLPRWSLANPADTYPLSPAQETLGDVAMLQAMERTHLRAVQKAVDPPVMAHRTVGLKGIAFDPGVLIPVDRSFASMSRPQFEPVPMGNPGISAEDIQRIELRVNRAFLVDVMRTLTGRAEASPLKATEVIGRREEALASISPVVMRLSVEWLTKLCDRVQAERVRQGVVEPPPDGLGGPLRWTFTSAAAMAVRSSEIEAISRFLTHAAPLMQVDPNAAKALDVYAMLATLQDATGVSPSFLREPTVFEEDMQMDAQMQQAAALAPAAKDTAAALVDLKQAGVM